jgi:hypothetical protein
MHEATDDIEDVLQTFTDDAEHEVIGGWTALCAGNPRFGGSIPYAAIICVLRNGGKCSRSKRFMSHFDLDRSVRKPGCICLPECSNYGRGQYGERIVSGPQG